MLIFLALTPDHATKHVNAINETKYAPNIVLVMTMDVNSSFQDVVARLETAGLNNARVIMPPGNVIRIRAKIVIAVIIFS